MKHFLITAVLSLVFAVQGVEYFVSPAGSNSADGRSEKSSFKTIRKGMDVLKPGDTLTILPGAYHEAVRKVFDGDPAKKTVIRAKVPGTVLIHGDLPLGNFKLHDQNKGIYVTECASEPESVFEKDTFTLYERQNKNFLILPVPAPASCYYDAQKKQLYVRTSDGAAPSKHKLARGVFPADGFALLPGKSQKVTNVEIDGLTVRGFMTQKVSFFFASWGIVINSAQNCRIKRCTAVLNCGGISMNGATDSRIEECSAIGNGTLRQVSGGNIIIWSGNNSVIDKCFSYLSRTYGIRFYGSNQKDTISRSVSIDDKRGSIWIKPCDRYSKLSEVFAPSLVACNNSEYSVFNENDYDRSGKNGATSLVLKKEIVHGYRDSFADDSAFDFRLTKESKVKQGFAGKDFCYLSWKGDDRNDGLSRKTPRKTLKGLPRGTTVYLLPGRYQGDLHISQDEITLAGYGQYAPAVIEGSVKVTGNNVTLRKLGFTTAGTAVISSGKALTLESCGFSSSAVAVNSEKPVTITHCAFAENVKKIISNPESVIKMSILNKVPAAAVLFGNAYPAAVPAQDAAGVRLTAHFNGAAAGDFTLKNEDAFRGTAPDGTLIGPVFFLFGPAESSCFNMKFIPTGSTSGSLQFESDAVLKNSNVIFREKGGKWRTVSDNTVATTLAYVSLENLKPGTQYECFATSNKRNCYVPGNRYLPEKINYKKPGKNRSATLSFTTPAADFAPKTIYVSVTGDDQAPGTKAHPMRTISAAALKTVPGDTVIVRGGVYQESVLIPVSGAPGKPVTYCAAPGETVWLDGNNRQFCRGFAAFGKRHLRFDGFRIRMFGTALINASGVYNFFHCRDIKVTRSFYDGRSPGYSPHILHARFCRDILLKNSVAINCMGSIAIVDSNDINIENNVLQMTNIWPLVVWGNQKNAVRFVNNIVSDNLRAKTHEPFLKMAALDNIVEADNIYFARYPGAIRKAVGLHNNKKWTLDEFYRLKKKNGGSFYANPNFAAVPKLLTWKTPQERAADMKKGPAFGRGVNNYEFGRDPQNQKRYRVWDFKDFFARPVRKNAGGKVIGLEPEAFRGFSELSKTDEKWYIFQ
ncbi:MAG: right-handed parallel beta-helix repeat-containing protein [Lentisphaeria bacterium]|nr:right-handed parallel beta-helix repeat-containing protein [Lentisphaeria bacterium]